MSTCHHLLARVAVHVSRRHPYRPRVTQVDGGDDLWCGSLMASTTPGRLVVQNLPGTPAARKAHNTPSADWGDAAAPADEESPIVARAPRAWR